jgi:hypothetical protein
VPADPVVSGHLGLDVGTPVLLLHAVTNDAYGRGLEWSTVWHQPSTVFDVEATVEPADGAVPDLGRVRELVAELTSLIDPGPGSRQA